MTVTNAVYAAWDEKKTVECQYDPDYTRADCLLRKRPQGIHPIVTVYTNEDSVYEIRRGQNLNEKQRAVGRVTQIDSKIEQN